MSIETSRWDEDKYGPMRVDSVLSAIERPEYTSVRWGRCEAGADFGGTGFETTVYVLAGRARINDVEIGPGDVLTRARGAYTFAGVGDESFEYINAYLFPEEHRAMIDKAKSAGENPLQPYYPYGEGPTTKKP